MSSATSGTTLGMLSGMTDEKIRENRLRRMAARQGLTLTRSKRRDPRALDYGVYWIGDANNQALLTNERGIDLDEVEKYLTGSA